jgi:ABC-2 type transport system ATP-binding protein
MGRQRRLARLAYAPAAAPERRGRAGHSFDRSGDGSAIVVEGLQKAYGSRAVLHGIDLEVRASTVTCLLGPNGAGKTTTVEILEGFRSRNSGTVRVLGVDPEGQPLALRQRIGVVLQECALPGELRVAELLDAYRDYYPRPRSRDELLELVELSDRATTLIRHLSGGQRRRLDLALALIGDPELVFLDEPTTGFDPAARRRCWAAIRNLVELGKTVLLTTHYMDEAQELADHVVVLVDGSVAAEGAPHELVGSGLAPSCVSFHLTPAERAAELPQLAGEVRVNRRGATVTTREPNAVVYELLDWARRSDVEVSGLVVAPPRLEDIYLSLTGAEMASEGD